MPPALRPFRHEEINNGEVVYLLTDVEYGHDGIKNLQHYVPFAQNEWFLEQTVGTPTLTFPFDSATSRITSRITSTGVTDQGKIRKRFILPQDFGNFPTGGLVFVVKRSASAPTSFKVTLLKGGSPDSVVNAVNVQATAGLTFELKTLSPGDTYFPGDFLTLEFDSLFNAASQFNEVVDIEILYITARGNVAP